MTGIAASAEAQGVELEDPAPLGRTGDRKPLSSPEIWVARLQEQLRQLDSFKRDWNRYLERLDGDAGVDVETDQELASLRQRLRTQLWRWFRRMPGQFGELADPQLGDMAPIFAMSNAVDLDDPDELYAWRRSAPSHKDLIRANAAFDDAEAEIKTKLQAASNLGELPMRAKAPVKASEYRFHLEIEKVSGRLYSDGHYKQAALEAYIRVIEEVRRTSGVDLDGDRLMNRAFGCTKQKPLIRFNSLQSQAEKDEQNGFLYLFKGVVALRNSKAHSTQLFNDPSRAFEYLALASVLMRVLEIATVSKKT